MNHNKLLILLIFFYLFSCSKEEKNNLPFLDDKDSFPSLCGERILSEYSFVFPQGLLATEQNLIVNDRNDSTLMISFPFANNGKNPKFIGNIGLGPDDFMNIRTLALSGDSTLFIFDSVLQNAKWFNPTSDLSLDRQHLISEKALTDENLRGDLISAGNNGLIVSMVTGDKMFIILSNEREKKSFGDYPGSKDGMDNPVKFEMQHQFALASNYKGDRFVCAGRNNDWLAFFSINDSIKLLKDYFSEETITAVDEEITGGSTTWSLKETPDSKIYFVDLLPSKEFIFAVYKGITLSERNSEIQKPTYILKFDWEGNFLKGYTLNKPSGSKTITPDGKWIIAVVESENEIILEKFELN